jgi:hypothetical protein
MDDIDKAHDQFLRQQSDIADVMFDIEEACGDLNRRRITLCEAGRKIGLLASRLEDLGRDLIVNPTPYKPTYWNDQVSEPNKETDNGSQ